MRRFLVTAALAAASAALLAAPALAGPGGVKTWRITITNLTPAGSQPLSPPLAVVHSKAADVWTVGQPASTGVAAIAEDADNTVLSGALAGVSGVRSVATAAGGPIMPGTERTFSVQTRGNADRLTLLSMLVNTNDGFTGLDSFHLHGQRDVIHRMAYDAGSELNDELAASIPGPCCGNPGAGTAEMGVIVPHAGIQGIGDLAAATYGWNDPVVRIEVERIG